MLKAHLRQYGLLPVTAAIAVIAVVAFVVLSVLIYRVIMGGTMTLANWLVTILAPALIALAMSNFHLRLSMTLDRAHEDLRRISESDHLTTAYNRRYFIEKLQQEVERARRYGCRFTIAFIDVDDFEGINDRHGHLGGDEVLRRLADACAGQLRATGTFARIGGEEFAILMPEMAPADALHLLKRLRADVQAMRIELQEAVVSVTVSIGLATQGNHDQSLNRILSHADRCLYAAKREGKNRVVYLPGVPIPHGAATSNA